MISMRTSLILFSLLISVPLAVLADDVQAYSAKGVDLKAFRTYKWDRNVANTRYGIVDDDPKFGPMVRRAVDENLVKKGLSPVTENPDVLIRTLVLNSVSTQLEALIFNWAGAVDWYSGDPMISIGRYNRAGTLVVNMVDAKTEKSVWLGIVVKSLGKPEKIEKDVLSAANKLFKKYPVGK